MDKNLIIDFFLELGNKYNKYKADQSNFIKFRYSLTELITSSHTNHVNKIIGSNYVQNPKCIWSYAKLKRTDNIGDIDIGVPTLKTGTKVCNSDFDKAEALTKHVHNIFIKPKINITLFDYVLPFESSPQFPLMQMAFYLRLNY